jgi:FkbM family methyltransferase
VVQSALRRRGLQVVPYLPGTGEAARRAKLMRSLDADVLLDVGANAGQYGIETRRGGFEGRIVSFEPLPDAYAELQRNCAEDAGWECRNYALGSEDGKSSINVAGNSYSSSLLPMADRHRDSAPESAYVGEVEIEVRTLDSIWEELVPGGETAFLKLDVQGFEAEVLKGAAGSLDKVVGVQSELSLVPLYEGAPLYREIVDHLEGLGFRLAGLEPGFEDPDTGEMLQADGVFVRR